MTSFTVIFHQGKVWTVYAVMEGDVILRDQTDETQALRVALTDLSEGALRQLRAAGWVKESRVNGVKSR